MLLSLNTRWFRCPAGGLFARRDTGARSGRGWNRNEFSHPHQVVSSCREGENPSYLEQSAMFQFAQQRDVFQPAEALLDPFAFLLTHGVAGVPSGAPIDGAAAASAIVLCHMRRDVHVKAFIDEVLRVETLVAAHRDA